VKQRQSLEVIAVDGLVLKVKPVSTTGEEDAT
jgi:hypothetical protein